MTYEELTYKLCSYAIKVSGINYAAEGDVYDLNADTIKNYPVFYVTAPGTHDETNNVITYNVTLFYIDRLNYDSKNYTQIQSTGINVLHQIISKLKYDDSILDIALPIQYQPFTEPERFSDKCAGVYCSISITTAALNNCY